MMKQARGLQEGRGPAISKRAGAVMSLVGNLRDLALGDVLQVIGLSRKSGVLSVKTEDSEGRVILDEGRVVSAVIQNGRPDITEGLIEELDIPAALFEEAATKARTSCLNLRSVLIETALLDPERVDVLCRQAVEAAMVELFGWTEGEFRLDVGAYSEPEEPVLLYPTGLDVQYLAMESARALDELNATSRVDEWDDQRIEEISLEEMFGVVEEECHASETESPPVSILHAEPVDEPPQGGSLQGSKKGSVLILIDPDPAVLDWVRSSVENLFETVHAFQQTGPAMTRVRQYLVRGEFPAVLVAPNVKIDRLGGVTSVADYMARLKGQSPRLRTLWLCEFGQPTPRSVDVADGIVTRPLTTALRDGEGRRGGASEENDVKRFRDDLLNRL